MKRSHSNRYLDLITFHSFASYCFAYIHESVFSLNKAKAYALFPLQDHPKK